MNIATLSIYTAHARVISAKYTTIDHIPYHVRKLANGILYGKQNILSNPPSNEVIFE